MTPSDTVLYSYQCLAQTSSERLFPEADGKNIDQQPDNIQRDKQTNTHTHTDTQRERHRQTARERQTQRDRHRIQNTEL